MADDVELIALAREIDLHRFTAGSARNVSRQPRRFRNPTKVFDFSVRSDILQHREAEMCEFDRPCNISPLVSLMLDQVHVLKSLGISAEIIGDEKLRTGQKRVETEEDSTRLYTVHPGRFCRPKDDIFGISFAMKGFRVLLELLEALQRAKTAITAKYRASHIYTGKRIILYTAKFCFADRKPLISFSFLNHFLQSRTRHNQYSSR